MSQEQTVPLADPAPSPDANPESPWLGLRPFTKEARDYFFGRGTELQDLYERIVHKPLTILFGQSGLGKTSLLQAALVPRLGEAGYLPVPLRLEHTPNAPPLEEQVISSLVYALYPMVFGSDCEWAGLAIHEPLRQLWGSKGADGNPGEGEKLWLLFHDPQYGFTGADGKGPDGGPPVRPVFLFDQFEEIFTLGERPERREDSLRFRDALACLVENRVPEPVRRRLETDDALADRLDYSARPAKVLLTLREDFLHVLERWRRQLPSLMDNRMELRLLTGPQALQAVVEPGKLRGPDRSPIVSPETGAAIVRFVAGMAADVPLEEIDAVPPLLSLICSELNARRFDPGGRMREETIRPDQLQGRSEDILQDFYRGSFQNVPQALEDLVEDRLLSADGFRESLALDSAVNVLEHSDLSAAEASAAIARLVDRRLLVVEERGGVRRVELTHDVLTSVARACRDKRLELRATEQARQEKALAEARADEQKRTIRRARRRNALMMVLTTLSIVALCSVLAQWHTIRLERKQALLEHAVAVNAAQVAERREQQAKKAEQEAEQAKQSAGLAEQKANASAQAAAKSLEDLHEAQEKQEKALRQSQADDERARDAETQAHKLEVSKFLNRYVAALASGNEAEAEALFTDPTDYEGYGPIHKKTLRADLRQTIKSYPFRNYTVVGEPTVTEDGKNRSLEFTMQYTLMNKQKLAATGILRVMMKVNDQLQITRVRESVIQAHKPP